MATVFRRRRGELIVDGEHTQAETTLGLFGAGVGVCNFCGEDRAVAWWRGMGADVAVCHGCALDALPKLLADALVGETRLSPRTVPAVQRGLQDFERTFWRAVALALDRLAELDRLEAQAPPPRRHNGAAARNGHAAN